MPRKNRLNLEVERVQSQISLPSIFGEANGTAFIYTPMTEEHRAETSESFPETEPVKNRSGRWRYGCLAVLLLLAAVYYLAGRAVGTVKPWVWNRNEKAKNGTNNAGPLFSAWVGFTTSQIGTNAVFTHSQGDSSCVDFSSVTVRTVSEHPLSIACAEKIAQKLKTIPAIKRIEFLPNGPIIGKTEPLPPWILQVNVDNLSEWFVPNRSLSGAIEVAFGTAAVRQPCTFGDGEEAPLIRFEYCATNDVRFTCNGISSQSVFYDKIAEEIAKKSVQTIETEIGKLSDISMTLPKLPEPFYPAYREATETPPIPGLVSKTTVIDGRRLILPHYSLERVESNFDGTDDEFLAEIQKSMNQAGWQGGVNKSGEHSPAYMRLTKGSETFYLFKEQPNKGFQLNVDLLGADIQKKSSKEESPTPRTHVFLLERTEKMNRDSVLAAIQTLLDENAPASALLLFTNRVYGSPDLQEKIRTRLLDLKTGTPSEQLALVRFFEQIGEKENARQSLLKAWQIRNLTPYPKPDDDYVKLAKKLEIEEEMTAQPPPSAELCELLFVRCLPQFRQLVMQFDMIRMVGFDGQIVNLFRFSRRAQRINGQHRSRESTDFLPRLEVLDPNTLVAVETRKTIRSVLFDDFRLSVRSRAGQFVHVPRVMRNRGKNDSTGTVGNFGAGFDFLDFDSNIFVESLVFQIEREGNETSDNGFMSFDPFRRNHRFDRVRTALPRNRRKKRNRLPCVYVDFRRLRWSSSEMTTRCPT